MIYVHIGPAAIRCGRYWVPVLTGNRWLNRRFTTADRALEYARLVDIPDNSL